MANKASDFARQEVKRILARALWQYRSRTAAAIALLALAKLLMVLVPVLLKSIVDHLSRPQSAMALPVFLLLGYALLRFAGGLFTELRDMVFARVTQSTVADFTLRIFDHLHRLGARFHSSRRTGALARDVERGTAGVGFLLGTGLFTLLPTLVEITAVMLILALGYSLWYVLIVAITFTFYSGYTLYFTNKRSVYQRRLNGLDSAASGRMVDSLLNYETVKFYANENLESRRLTGILQRWIRIGLDNQRALSRLHIGQSGIIAAGVSAVMLLAGEQVVYHRMTVGDLVLINAYIIQLCLPLNTLGLIFSQVREAFINAERVCDLLRQPPEAAGSDALPPLQVSEASVKFEGVNFGYEPGRQVLWDINLEISAGHTVAVVGSSGSGKSTLGRLLFRFYDPDAGHISIDGQDLRTVHPASVRKSVGIVPQDTLLFNETIAYNIGYGRPDACRDEIVEAAKGARLHDFVQSLPAHYETMVGERGVKLSGGERQRIAIARALLKNPPIIVFDEATSALDTRTERAIQAELDRISRDRTTLIVAHRLSTIVEADTIVVLDHGRIVERGTHAELLQKGGIYCQMWALQRQQSALEEAGMRMTLQPVNLVALVAGVLDAARSIIDEKGVNLYTLIGSEAARITGDPSALQQFIWDLCMNAVAATPRGGRMELRLERAGPVTRLSVTDGRLAPIEAMAAVGASEEENELLQGLTPLDPAWAAATAEKLGGVFRSNIGATHSLTYSIEFPLRAVAPLSTVAPALPEVSLDGLVIAVVDDQQEARELISVLLADHGATVRAFKSGQEVLNALVALPVREWPRVLICDISLADVDGYEVIRRIRQMEAQRGAGLPERMPAVALSGHARPEDRLRALLAGFQIHVAKPVDQHELLATVRAVLRSA
jgi:ATP-binding cassette subfamily B protein